ncbi:RNA-binding domain-containing protein [Xylaria sp. FL0064]|nr:RNA-binding domain-containing protein [Xylaria sp. FL0064]
MHCVRRAALRAACSSSRLVAVPRQQVGAIAMQISKSSVQPRGALSLPRYFSQTSPVAEDDVDGKSAVESAIRAAEQGGSTAADDTPLQSSPTESELGRTQGHVIYVSNMTFDATETHLNEAFGKYGEILASNIGRDPRGLSRGFGFITFATKEAADRAVNEAHSSFWHGRRINVDHRKARSSNSQNMPTSPTDSLFIGNIPYETSDAELNKLFRSLENVKDVRVAIDRNTGWPRGFAHADFVDIESATRAFDVLSEVVIGGRKLRVDYAQSRKQERSRQQQQQQQQQEDQL